MCFFPLVFKEEEGGGGVLSVQTKQQMKMMVLAISISLTQVCTVRFFNDLFVRSLTRSLDIRHAALTVLVF